MNGALHDALALVLTSPLTWVFFAAVLLVILFRRSDP